MDTKLIVIDRQHIDPSEFTEASRILQDGGLVAFPTETVYGLGGNALDAGASAKIYAAKGRPSDNPLIVHISKVSDIEELAYDIPDIAYALADRFWPGPMTMILKKKDIVPKATTGGLDTVAIRLPSDEIARTLISESGVFIAAPSANSSGRPSPTCARHVYEDLNGKIDMIIDGGDCEIGLESSIIDLTGDEPLILRPGFITKEDFAEVVRQVEYDRAVQNLKPDVNIIPKAPGMKYKHYAPKGNITIVKGDKSKVTAYINQMLEDKRASDGSRKYAVMCAEENVPCYRAENIYSVGKEKDAKSITSSLFRVLRQLDEDGVDIIYSEEFAATDKKDAIMNRLYKAAGYNIVEV